MFKTKKKAKIKTKSKRAVTHIEMIISFSLFIIFLLFIFIYLNPVKPPDVSAVLLDIVEEGLEETTTVYLLQMPVKVTAGNCFTIPNPFDTNEKKRVFIKNSEEQVVPFNLTFDSIIINSSDSFFYLHYSAEENFTTDPAECAPIPPIDYNFSAPRLLKLYSASLLEDLKDDYQTEYESLKEQFNFPGTMNFAIIIPGYFELRRTVPEAVPVVARELPIELLVGTDIIKTRMNIRVW